jgi:DNA uptake protein ComE-like DNA-binding protein
MITALLVPVMGLGLYRLAVTEPLPDLTPAAQAPSAVGFLIDPNTAPWWEMTVIPGVGEVTAKRIVEFREVRRRGGSQGSSAQGALQVFRRPADLQQVKGLGPKTVERIAPYLAFSPADSSLDDP